MISRLRAISCSATLLGAITAAPTVSAASTCESLASLKLPDVTSITAKSFAGGTFQPPDPAGFVPTPAIPHAFPPITALPPFCEVSIVVSPAINIEIWLPLPAAWNTRFRGVGGGGYAGTISWSALAIAVEGGSSTASTDTGHSAFAPNNGLGGGGFALNQPADTLNFGLIEDFAERSELELAHKGKAVTRAFYGTGPRFSYWTGCSTGGRQGWIMAQRHPEEYDGLVTGSPAFNWDRFIPAELWGEVVMKDEVGAPISPAKLTAVSNAAVAACAGHSGDGTLTTDAFLADPRLCTFNPAQMSCSAQPGNPNCLTSQEAGAVSKIWDGPRDAKGQRLWFGLDRGATLLALDGPTPFTIATDHFAYWIHQNPSFDWHTVTESSFVTDFFTSEAKFEDVIGTDSTDLDDFIDHKSKDITYHGSADQLIFSRGTVNYFERLRKKYGADKVDQFARLFRVPGMGHCTGGAGPNAFGNNDFGGPPVPADPQHDVFQALINWVEFGNPPDQIIATKYVNDTPADGIAFTRPLCVFPKVAKYKGVGNSADAANWTCEEGLENGTTEAADAVLRDRGDEDHDDRSGGRN
jgi:pimeloyl-ACP methyl ester carboxylesterase